MRDMVMDTNGIGRTDKNGEMERMGWDGEGRERKRELSATMPYRMRSTTSDNGKVSFILK